MLATLSGQVLDVGSTTPAGHRHTSQRDAFTIARARCPLRRVESHTRQPTKPPDALNTIGAKPKIRPEFHKDGRF
jgi:hypothetical protein